MTIKVCCDVRTWAFIKCEMCGQDAPEWSIVECEFCAREACEECVCCQDADYQNDPYA
jgi:hypothetical protein